MKVFTAEDGPLFVGYRNSSPLLIGLTDRRFTVPEGESRHYHDFHEYYLVLAGQIEVEVEGRIVVLKGPSLLMVQPGEAHEMVWVDPGEGAQWVIVQEHSVEGGKHLAER